MVVTLLPGFKNIFETFTTISWVKILPNDAKCIKWSLFEEL